ncbi:hypothetical protein R69919_02065 [Paraburkholderia gardini]|nr:hypothetical protein R69919_02065 [Paraburkholderia gardini]
MLAARAASPLATSGCARECVCRSLKTVFYRVAMTAQKLHLDHLVVTARTLDEGTQYVADTLGIAPAGGGTHPLMRTHNRLLNLWGGIYLEVIAIDPQSGALPAGTDIAPRPRLFALDAPATHARLESGPYLSHWVARVERPKNLPRWREQYPERIAPVVPMSRGDFTWSLTVPDDGAFPAWQGSGDGIAPSLIQWDTALHPSTMLPEPEVALKSLKGFHPQADVIRAQLEWLGAAHLIALDTTPDSASLVAEFETPAGLRTLK